MSWWWQKCIDYRPDFNNLWVNTTFKKLMSNASRFVTWIPMKPQGKFKLHCILIVENATLLQRQQVFYQLFFSFSVCSHRVSEVLENYGCRIIVSSSNFRETGHPLRGAIAVIPRHHPDHRKFYHTTTYKNDYFAPYPILLAVSMPCPCPVLLPLKALQYCWL